MELKDLNKKKEEGAVKQVTPPPLSMADILAELKRLGFSPKTDASQYDALFQTLRTVRQPVSAAPTFVPKSFLEMFQFYSSGGTYRLYVFVGDTWRYVALT